MEFFSFSISNVIVLLHWYSLWGMGTPRGLVDVPGVYSIVRNTYTFTIIPYISYETWTLGQKLTKGAGVSMV